MIFPPLSILLPMISALVLFEKLIILTPTPAAVPPTAIFKLLKVKVSDNEPSEFTPFKSVLAFNVILP